MDQTSTTLRKILSNEFAQLSGICVALWFFVQTVILPLNNIQFTQVQIQVTLADMKSINFQLDNRITKNTDRIIILEQQVAYLKQK